MSGASPRIPRLPTPRAARSTVAEERATARREYEDEPTHRSIEEDGGPAFAMAAYVASHMWLADQLEEFVQQLQTGEAPATWVLPEWIRHGLQRLDETCAEALRDSMLADDNYILASTTITSEHPSPWLTASAS